VDEISEILKCYPGECAPAVVEPLGSAGGMSGARFWRLVAPRGTLMLRCWPNEHPTPQRLAFIHSVLRHAAAKGMAILPVPIVTSRGETFVDRDGRLWELAPWLPGSADYELAPRRERLSAAMEALASFHVAVADIPATPPQTTSGTVAPAVGHRLTRLQELQSSGYEVWSRAIVTSHWPELAPLAREYVALAPRIVPPAIAQLAPFADAPMPLQVCIRDVWHDHVLFEGDRVTGIVDFGAIEVDTPATDIARLLGSLVGDEEAGWQAGLEAYAQVRPLTLIERKAVQALDAAGTILAACNWIRWIYVDGRDFDDRRQVVARFERLLERTRRLPDV
jgi:homoserine kinase type II